MTNDTPPSMRAALVHEGAREPVLGITTQPQPAPGQVVVDVVASSVNPIDLFIASGRHSVIRPPRPYIPGYEAVGRVRGDVGGGRVWWITRIGGLAEQAVASPDELVHVPPALSDDWAAAIGISGVAAWLALDFRARLKSGERVLIVGASGAVGRIAIQAARLLGAAQVVAAARSCLDELSTLGADTVVPIAGDGSLGRALHSAAAGGFDVIIDLVFGPPGQAAIENAAPGARVVVLGQLAGSRIDLSGKVVEKNLTIIGHRNAATPVSARRDAYNALARHVVAGHLHVEKDVYGLADVAFAWRAQAESPHRKLIVLP